MYHSEQSHELQALLVDAYQRAGQVHPDCLGGYWRTLVAGTRIGHA